MNRASSKPLDEMTANELVDEIERLQADLEAICGPDGWPVIRERIRVEGQHAAYENAAKIDVERPIVAQGASSYSDIWTLAIGAYRDAIRAKAKEVRGE